MINFYNGTYKVSEFAFIITHFRQIDINHWSFNIKAFALLGKKRGVAGGRLGFKKLQRINRTCVRICQIFIRYLIHNYVQVTYVT